MCLGWIWIKEKNIDFNSYTLSQTVGYTCNYIASNKLNHSTGKKTTKQEASCLKIHQMKE